MFNKLVVSTNERRQNRVIKFFCGTSLIYATVIAGVLALSVVVSSPRLADTSERMLALIAPPPPPGPPPRPRSDNPPPTVQPQNDPRYVTELDKVLATPPKPLPKIETLANDPSSLSAPGSPYSSSGTGTVPGGHGADEASAPPPPPPAPRPRDNPPPQVDTTRPVRLTSTVLQGKAIERRTPAYPSLAKAIHLSGSVSVEVMIALDGRVETARAISGHPLLVVAALEAARGWRFEPTLLNGTPVRVTGVIVFNFTMQ